MHAYDGNAKVVAQQSAGCDGDATGRCQMADWSLTESMRLSSGLVFAGPQRAQKERKPWC